MHAALLAIALLATAGNEVPPSRTPVELHLSVADAKGGKEIFSTSSAISQVQPLRVHVGQGDSSFSLAADVDSVDKDTVVLRVRWEEAGKDSSIKWEPLVRIKRGVATEARIDWKDGGGRIMKLTIQ